MSEEISRNQKEGGRPEISNTPANAPETHPVSPPDPNNSAPAQYEQQAADGLTNAIAQISDKTLVDRINASDRWTISLTAAIAISGLASAYIAHGQLNEMVSGSNQTGKLIDIATSQSNAALIQADAAQKQVRIMQGQLDEIVTSQRAFVFVASFYSKTVASTDGKTVISYDMMPQWENSGLTPTKNLVTSATWEIMPEKMADNFAFADAHGVKPTRFILGPKAVMNGGALDFPASVIQDIKRTGKSVYVYGWADYNDVFPNTPRHRTEFCSEVTLRDVHVLSETPFTFGVCGKYNGADSEAMKPPRPYPQ